MIFLNTKRILLFILLLQSYLTNAVIPANILFDFGNVIGEQPMRNVLPEIGFGNIFSNIFSNPLRIEEDYMDFLSTIEHYRTGEIMASNNDKILPKIMSDWLKGSKTPLEVRTIILAKIKEARPSIGKRKAKLWIAITNFMFTPARLAKVTNPKKGTIKIIKKCYRQKNYAGQRLHKLFLLTNFDVETFEILKKDKRFKMLFDYFDGIIVSGKVHLIKPDPAMYSFAFEEFQINPDTEFTIIIDDEYLNIEAAMRLNKKYLRCIQYKSSADLKKTLHHLDVIP